MKQHYLKPVLTRVELVTDQAALTACKVSDLAPGPTYVPGISGDCETGTGAQCFEFGS